MSFLPLDEKPIWWGKNCVVGPSARAFDYICLVIAFIMLITTGISSVSASDTNFYLDPTVSPIGSSTPVGLFQVSIPYANNLTAGEYKFFGRNGSYTGHGLYSYANLTGVCNDIDMKDFDTGNYVFDMDVSYTASALTSYNANFTLEYYIKNLQAGNLTGSNKRFVNMQLGNVGPCDHVIQVGYDTFTRSDSGTYVKSNNLNDNIFTVGWSGYRLLGGYGYPAGYRVNSSYSNVTFHTQSLTTGLPIENSMVEFDYFEGSASVTGRTDVYGNVTFSLMPTNATENRYYAYATGYSYTEGSLSVTDAETYEVISMNPTSLPNSTNYIKVTIKDASNNLYLENAILSVYEANRSQWNNRTSASGTEYVTKTGIALDKELVYEDGYTFVATKEGYDEANITIQYTSGGQLVELFLMPSTILSTDYELWVDVLDSTGNTIGGSNINLYDTKYNQWKNVSSVTGQTAFTTSGKYSQFPIAYGRRYNITATALGYDEPSASILFKEPYSLASNNTNKRPVTLVLTLESSIPSGNYSCNVYTLDSSGTPVSGVAVISSDGQGKTTSSAGLAQFILPAGSYTMKASKAGYNSAVGYTTGVSGDKKTLSIVMVSTTIVTATLTATPTPTITGYGGSTINGTAAVCGVNTDGTVLGYLKSQTACWGAKDYTSQSLMLAALVITVFMFFGARFGKGLGAAIGASAGFVIAIAAQLIPVWVFFAMVIITGLIFALRLYMADRG